MTHHPNTDRMIDWMPDGSSLIFASSMESPTARTNQLFRVNFRGGLPQRLPIPYGEFGALAPDGRRLAYTPQSIAFRTWKRYRGGLAPDVWLFDLETLEAENLTDNPAVDAQPLWHGGRLYFLSDRGPRKRMNLWTIEPSSKEVRQVTNLVDYDVRFPSAGPHEIAFEAGGRLYLLDPTDETVRQVRVEIPTDQRSRRRRVESVQNLVAAGWVSPSGRRAVIQSRGDLFMLPAEHGPLRSLTRSPGVAERYPTWSPDGERIAYWSDRTGEYELWLRAADGSGGETRLTNLGPGYRYFPVWSPDSSQIGFLDEKNVLRILDVATRSTSKVDRLWGLTHGDRLDFIPGWSPDSRWLAYARRVANGHRAVFLYDCVSVESHQVTAGYFSDSRPAFDPAGEHLYYISNRGFELQRDAVDRTWVIPRRAHLVVATLRSSAPSPLAPRNDEELDEVKDETEEDDGAVEGFAIDLEGFERRAVVLPAEAGEVGQLEVARGKVLYVRVPEGRDDPELVYWDVVEREVVHVAQGIDYFTLAAGGEHMLVWRGNDVAIVQPGADRELSPLLRTNELEVIVDPHLEWRQLFDDTWRFVRDFFYDPHLHGVDWNAERERYAPLLERASTREDVNFVLGEMIAELNASHAYRLGGDMEQAVERGVGLLGVDWELAEGAYRIAHVFAGAAWEAEVRSPLAAPGLGIAPGDWVLAVDGVRLDPTHDPWRAFQGTVGRVVELLVNDRPHVEGARRVLVEPLASERELRYRAWVEESRRFVERASGGRVGYLHLRDTGRRGHRDLVRQLEAWRDRDGLIVDERFNAGGMLPDRMIELLNREILNYQAVRHGPDEHWPRILHSGPKILITNGWSGSGGDALPDFWRKRDLGPIVGTRTWGGRIGLRGSPQLIDGGEVTVPNYRNYDPDGNWFAEGHGVVPDIQVPQDPTALARGEDLQLLRGVEEALRLLEDWPKAVTRPPYEDRSAAASSNR